MKPLRFIAIIPARFASTRFPGKPLAMLGSKTVIQRVYEQVSKAIDNVLASSYIHLSASTRHKTWSAPSDS